MTGTQQHTAHASRDLCPQTGQPCDCPGACLLEAAVPPPEGCEVRRLPAARKVG